MAEPLTVRGRRRRVAERAGATAILLAGPLVGLALFALTGGWPWIVVALILLPIVRLGARQGRPLPAVAELPRGAASARAACFGASRPPRARHRTPMPLGAKELEPYPTS